MAVKKGQILQQLDINNAFLRGELVEEIDIQKPPRYNKGQPHKVSRLNKNIYGLKQTSRHWNGTFCVAITKFGFPPSKANYNLFIKKKEGSFTALLVYVDDIILIGSNPTVIKEVKNNLNHTFQIKEIGVLNF